MARWLPDRDHIDDGLTYHWHMRRLAAIPVLLTLLLAGCQTATPEPEPVEIVQPAPPVVDTDVVPRVAPVEEDAIAMATVRVGALNVRTSPSTRAAIVSGLELGDRVALIREEKGWSRIRLRDGQMGWVSSQYLRKERASTCPPDRAFRMTAAPSPAFSDSDSHGTVTIEATVNLAGTVVGTRVIANTTGDDELARLAGQEIRTARFEPPVRDCRPQQFFYVYRRTF